MKLRGRFWLLTSLRWLPTGLLLPVYALLPLHKGLDIAEFGAVVATQGLMVLLLELPTSGFADSLGRRPVVLASAVAALASYLVFTFADNLALFMLASALSGVFRALDSGPLNAWYVDETIAAGDGDKVAVGISGAATATGLAISVGAVAGGGLVAWAPFPAADALATPFLLAAVLTVLQFSAVAVLMKEKPGSRSGTLLAAIRQTPLVMLEGARLLKGNRVLLALLGVGMFWGFGTVAFEQFLPIRLAELLANPETAGVLMGPVSAAAWGISAAGAAVIPLALRRWSMPAISVVLALGKAALVVAMGLAAGPLGLIVAFFAVYAVHSAAGAVYESQLHNQVDGAHRATVLSLASLGFQPAGSLGALVLGLVAEGTATGFAMVLGGVVLALAAPLFLVQAKAASPAWKVMERPGKASRK